MKEAAQIKAMAAGIRNLRKCIAWLIYSPLHAPSAQPGPCKEEEHSNTANVALAGSTAALYANVSLWHWESKPIIANAEAGILTLINVAAGSAYSFLQSDVSNFTANQLEHRRGCFWH